MILVDLETTDLLNEVTEDPEAQPGIVQIGLVEIRPDWTVKDAHEYLVNPEKPAHLWDPKAIAAHGITPQMVSDAPPLSALLPTLSLIFREHAVWVGYNNQFDRKALYYQACRYGWAWKFPWPSSDIDIMAIGKDVMNMAGKRDVKAPKLIELHHHLLGEGFDNAHNALADCMATFRCGSKLVDLGVL